MTTGNSGSDGKAALDASLMVVVGGNTAFSCELFLKAIFAIADEEREEGIS